MSKEKQGCYGKKGSCDVSGGKVVVVAVKASAETSRKCLVWALTHVAQPGDCIKLLLVIPAITTSNNRVSGFSRLATTCITNQWRSSFGSASDQKEVSVKSCSQMVLQLHDLYDPEKVRLHNF